MRIIRGLAGSLLWIAAGLLGLVSILLCATIILLPLGIPLLSLSRRLMTTAVRLMLPPAVAHPVKESRKGLASRRDEILTAPSRVKDATSKKARRAGKGVDAMVGKAAKKTRRKRKVLGKRLG